LIKEHSGTPTQHTFLDSYLGNEHPRYPINAPTLRKIARDWMRAHKQIEADDFAAMLTSLVEGESSTEKIMAGVLMDYATKEQWRFDAKLFDNWLEHLVGWAEVDAVCTGKYTVHQIPVDWKKWKPLLVRFSKSKDIHKRRASLVLLCSPIRYSAEKDIAFIALENIDRVKHEKEILITKAVSWLLRSMIKKHKTLVAEYIRDNKSSLPPIAVRETMTKLKTGKKTPKVKKKPGKA
jgi:3-methyladenine DNA glycosylase AlkD